MLEINSKIGRVILRRFFSGGGQAQDLYDLLDTTIREFDDENEMTNVPDSIFLVIGEDTPEDADFDELDEVTWSKVRVSYKDIEYTRKK